VDSVERHIRIKGPAKLTMHFTSMIFPNGSVVEIPGQVNSLPGSDGPKVKGDEGTVQQSSSVGDVAKAAGQGAAIGAGVGGISGGVNGHPVEGLGLAQRQEAWLARRFRCSLMATTLTSRRGRRSRWCCSGR
jgi:hypothetical protein